MTTENINTAELDYSAQLARGDFAFWPQESEASWRAANPPTPAAWPKITAKIRGYDMQVALRVKPNQRHPVSGSKWGVWAVSIAQGKSYMVGADTADAEFLRTHTSCLTAWQKAAFAWCREHPYWQLQFTLGRYEWHVYSYGEFVEYELPYHDHGGERSYISRDGRRKVLINVD